MSFLPCGSTCFLYRGHFSPPRLECAQPLPRAAGESFIRDTQHSVTGNRSSQGITTTSATGRGGTAYLQTLLISVSLGQTCWPYLVAPVLEQGRLVQLSVVKNNPTKRQIRRKILEIKQLQHLTEITSHSIQTLLKDQLLQRLVFTLKYLLLFLATARSGFFSSYS